MKMNRLESIFHIFYPKSCACCEANLIANETIICTNCRHDLPYFDNKDFIENQLSIIFKGRIPIKKAVAFFQFQKHGKAKNLIHQLKYQGRQEIGNLIGKWCVNQLKLKGVFDSVDCIIPVHLHKKKQRKRGYNQLTTFGRALS